MRRYNGKRQKEHYKHCLEVHATKRLIQRYGMDSIAVQNIIAEKIKRKEVFPVMKITCSRRLYVIELDGVEYIVLYSNTMRQIVTFLPPDSIEYQSYLEYKKQKAAANV